MFLSRTPHIVWRRAGATAAAARLALVILIALLVKTPSVSAQTATVRGFVTDREDGEAMQGVNVLLDNEDGAFFGTVTDNDGVYTVSRIPAGRYLFSISYIGYTSYRDTLLLRPGSIHTINVALEYGESEMGEVLVEAERVGGAARVTAGLQTVRPEDIELVPAPDVSRDLATYLGTMPGVVSIGDRGGQFFIRGGEPSHNMVLLDGMYVHQPFHILGFYSAFPSDIINRADVYAGGFGSQFSGRISSVIDIYSRNGNKKRAAGSVSLAPFVSGAIFEAPLKRDRVSILGSFRQSVIEQGADLYLKQPLPYTFGDAFGKLHMVLNDNQQLSFSVLHTHDAGVLGEPSVDRVLDEVRWQNTAYGLRYLFLSGGKPFLGELLFSVSHMSNELGPVADPVRISQHNSFNYAVNFTNFIGRTEYKYGIFARAPSLEAELGGLFQDLELGIGRRHKIGIYLEPDIHISSELRARVGVVAQLFSGTDINRFFEPRARFVWERGPHQVSAAAGKYHQEVIGLTDRRDATNVFTAWVSAPSENLTEAYHSIAGYRFHPNDWLEISTESFYKYFTNIWIAEWTSFPRFTSRMQRADGRALGSDLRIEVRRPAFYAYFNYGLSSVHYNAKQAALPVWYGVERLRFRPPHDRRHQLNILVSTKLKVFDVSVRWNYGSGLPYNQIIGFDGFVNMDGIQDIFTAIDSRRIIYDRPFEGILPAYHRLDISLERTFEWEHAGLALQAGAINVYNRRNLLALDIFTLRRSDQLPFVPTVGVKVTFN